MNENLAFNIMKIESKYSFVICLFFVSMCFISACDNKKIEPNQDHDTIVVMPNGEFTYNLPCKVVNINQETEGKSLLFIWLHGGVCDRSLHDFVGFNHLQCSSADDSVLNYLQGKGLKSVVLFPICHKAEIVNCVTWKECYADVKNIIDDYVNKGIVDPERIYLAGSSDGGDGTWDFLEINEKLFAAAMPMSCGNPRKASIPVYFFNTKSEPDCTDKVNLLNNDGCKIEYKYCPQYEHGGDGAECTHEFLDRFFAIKNN